MAIKNLPNFDNELPEEEDKEQKLDPRYLDDEEFNKLAEEFMSIIDSFDLDPNSKEYNTAKKLMDGIMNQMKSTYDSLDADDHDQAPLEEIQSLLSYDSYNDNTGITLRFDLSEKVKNILTTKRDKLFSKRYIPFTDKEFIDELELGRNELIESSTYLEKFKKYLPESWFDDKDDFDEELNDENCLGFVNFESTIKQHDNVFIKCVMYKNEFCGDSCIYCPITFLFYKNEHGQFEAYIPKYKNAINDDYSLLNVVKDCFTEQNYLDMKKTYEDKAKRVKACNDALRKTIPEFYRGAPDISYEGIFYNPVETPIMTINKLGALKQKTKYKQVGSGYVYIGDIELNDSEETRYFLSDFSLKPSEDNTVELYARITKMKLSDTDLHEIKDSLKYTFENNSLLMDETDLKANTDFCYIDLTNFLTNLG